MRERKKRRCIAMKKQNNNPIANLAQWLLDITLTVIFGAIKHLLLLPSHITCFITQQNGRNKHVRGYIAFLFPAILGFLISVPFSTWASVRNPIGTAYHASGFALEVNNTAREIDSLIDRHTPETVKHAGRAMGHAMGLVSDTFSSDPVKRLNQGVQAPVKYASSLASTVY